MGGQATKNFNTQRITNEEMEQVKSWLLNHTQQFAGHEFYIPISFPEKQDHGDIDLLTTLDNNELLASLRQNGLEVHPDFLKIHGEQKISNKGAVSLPVKISSVSNKWFQLDFIFVHKEYAKNAYYFYSYNCFNILLSKLFNAKGLKLGFQGLWWQLPSDHVLVKNLGKERARVYLTNDYFIALNMLGISDLNENNFETKFKTEQEAFDWLLNCPAFNHEVFNPVKQNSSQKRIKKKRAFVREFEKIILENGYTFSEQAPDFPTLSFNDATKLHKQASELGSKTPSVLSQAKHLHTSMTMKLVHQHEKREKAKKSLEKSEDEQNTLELK